MGELQPITRPASPRGRRLIQLAMLAALMLVGVWGAWKWWPSKKVEKRTSAPIEDPRLTYATSYLNVRPGVQYVGDAVCAECHADIADRYRKHPMGRALAPISETPEGTPHEKPRHLFDAQGFQYLVEHRGGQVIHKEVRRNPQGQVIAQAEGEVQFVLGSGTRGKSYLVNRDGHLFQSPVSWYSQKEKWDLSPGYRSKNMHFERGIMGECLFCHSNWAEPVQHSRNRYETPIFRGHAIGCERCHGPGELHVKLRERPEGPDHTIVNPRRLEPVLREAVCQQCHLQGEVRVIRLGRKVFDYRPGLPLHLFHSVFVRRPDLTDNHKAVSQVEQMRVSRCFEKSGGKMGCISCHDPHGLPEPAERVSFYRNRCLTCHEEQSCRLPPPVRRQQSKDDSCMDCHMKPFDSSDIAHTAITDHRILRRPDPSSGRSPKPALRPGEIPLVHFHAEQLKMGDPLVSRDFGVAAAELAKTLPPTGLRTMGEIIVSTVTPSLEIWPDDVVALEAKGHGLRLQGRNEEALAAFEAALSHAPHREMSLLEAAGLTSRMGNRAAAIGYMQRAIQANPWTSDYHVELASLHFQEQNWTQALRACRDAVRLNPMDADTRRLLIQCCVRAGERPQARAELEVLIGLKPQDRGILERWFAGL